MATTTAPTKSQRKRAAKKALKEKKKGLNETARRELSYRRDAGSVDASLDPSQPITLSPDSGELKFAKNLGSSNQKTRHRTALALESYLKAKASPGALGFSELDFMKLQKALFYCLWLCDKVPVQEELSDLIVPLLHACGGDEKDDVKAGEEYLRITQEEDENDDNSEEEEGGGGKGGEEGEEGENENSYTTPHCAGVHLSTLFISTFFRTVLREWEGVDQYRLDKIYSLVRKVVEQMYRYFAKRDFHQGVVAQFNDALADEVLTKTPNGMRFHVIDIAMDELAKVSRDLSTEEFIDVMEPYLALAMAEEDKIVKKKVFDNIFLKFLVKYSLYQDEKEEGDELIIFENVDVNGVAEFFFEAGKAEDTRNANRKQLYDMNKTYLKRIAKREREAAEGLFGEIEDGDDSADEEGGEEEKADKPKSKQQPPQPKRKRKASVDITEMRDSDDDLNSPPKDDRRVSFAAKNRSKGFKKSMKDLQTAEIILSPPPKHGALRKDAILKTQKKLEAAAAEAEEKKRKRAEKRAENKKRKLEAQAAAGSADAAETPANTKKKPKKKSKGK